MDIEHKYLCRPTLPVIEYAFGGVKSKHALMFLEYIKHLFTSILLLLKKSLHPASA